MNTPLYWRLYVLRDALRRSLVSTGWLRSIWTGKIQGPDKQPVPWLSYPAVHFLNSLDLTGARVFEYGSGASTLYWKERYQSGEIKDYAAAETNALFHYEMARQDGFYRDKVILYDEGDPAAMFAHIEEDQLSPHRPFDVTVVDGDFLRRHLELEHSLAITDSMGLIIVDDVQWFPHCVEEFCAKHRLYRIDFAGFAPAVSYQKITSILFKEPIRFAQAKVIVPEESISCPFLPV